MPSTLEERILQLKTFREKLYSCAATGMISQSTASTGQPQAQVFNSGLQYSLQKSLQTITPLASMIQDSAQQVLEQEQQQQQVQEQEFEAEKFNGDMNSLISRHNLWMTDYGCWNDYLSDEIKALLQKNCPVASTAPELFSRWVGAAFDAKHVITHITPEAVKELLVHHDSVQFGLDYDHLPAGFYLTSSQQNEPGVILGFNPALRDTMLRHARFDPLRQVLPEPMVKQPVAFDPSRVSLEEKQALNEVLSARLTDPLYQSQIGERNGFVTFFDLKKQRAPHEIFEAYGKEGLETFVTMEAMIFNVGGRPLLSAWENELLSYSPDASEFFTEQEMNAIAESVQCLNKTLSQDSEANGRQDLNKRFFTTLFSQHVKRHHRARYAEVWNAYKEFSTLINEDELSLMRANRALALWLASNPPFHAVIFLRYLTFVLKAARNQEFSQQIQQNILDHLNEIDWTHSGLFYGMRYKQGEEDQIYHYWDKDLVLTQGFPFNMTSLWGSFLRSHDKSDEYSRLAYDASLPYPDNPLDLSSSGDAIVNMLRFAASNMGLPWHEYETFKRIVMPIAADPQLQRLFILSGSYLYPSDPRINSHDEL